MRFGRGQRTRRSRLARALLVLLSIAIVLGLVMAGGAWWVVHRYTSNVARVPQVFVGLDEANRPAAADDGSVTFLLVGSDVRASRPTTGTGAAAPTGGRADTIMLVRLAGDRETATAVSIPRDSWVRVPGHGMHKINAAYAFGGATLLIHTVERVTGVRVDHFAVVDFAGFKDMTNALGGVDVQVRYRTSYWGVTFEQGWNHLNGHEALVYVRQRKNLPDGDLDRVRRQQNYIRAMARQVKDSGILTDPGRLDDFLLAFTGAVSVDDTLSNLDLLQLALSLRGLNVDDVGFFTAPVAGTGWEGDQSVVYLDRQPGARMWRQFETGALARNPAGFDTLSAVPR